jgi:hypothetical protein
LEIDIDQLSSSVEEECSYIERVEFERSKSPVKSVVTPPKKVSPIQKPVETEDKTTKTSSNQINMMPNNLKQMSQDNNLILNSQSTIQPPL